MQRLDIYRAAGILPGDIITNITPSESIYFQVQSTDTIQFEDTIHFGEDYVVTGVLYGIKNSQNGLKHLEASFTPGESVQLFESEFIEDVSLLLFDKQFSFPYSFFGTPKYRPEIKGYHEDKMSAKLWLEYKTQEQGLFYSPLHILQTYFEKKATEKINPEEIIVFEDELIKRQRLRGLSEATDEFYQIQQDAATYFPIFNPEEQKVDHKLLEQEEEQLLIPTLITNHEQINENTEELAVPSEEEQEIKELQQNTKQEYLKTAEFFEYARQKKQCVDLYNIVRAFLEKDFTSKECSMLKDEGMLKQPNIATLAQYRFPEVFDNKLIQP